MITKKKKEKEKKRGKKERKKKEGRKVARDKRKIYQSSHSDNQKVIWTQGSLMGRP